ncbi:hypothetical protein IU501_10985 [Nocardia otitidiscaviarum]|uniref:hypothetical protein n=1 Tax=Nocardia otitidiscaviarum TaxID=1823 RepID=UPI0018946978|nr:hypothetical protein [Nocardia otitidiscaviarum]MBF6133524.1 hypothetical protein [Nocardia otitidiscaviarum]
MTISTPYGRLGMSVLTKQVDLVNDELRAVLLDNTYTPDLDAHQFQSSLTGELATGNGYTAGGVVLTNQALTYDSVTNTAWLDADNPVWNPSTITARYCVIVDTQSGSAATNPLLCLIDFEEDKSSDNAAFEVAVAVTGLYRLAQQ